MRNRLFIDHEILYVKVLIFPKLIYRFNVVPIKTQLFCEYVEVDNLSPKFICKCNRYGIAKITLKEKHELRGCLLLGFKTYYKAIVIKAVWYRYKNRQINETE